IALRDQFIEGIRELRKLIREKPQSTLFDVREEAMMWVVEDRPHGANVARSRNIMSTSSEETSERTTTPVSAAQNDIAVALQEVVKIITQQGKAIGELTNAVCELTVQKVSSSGSQSVKPKVQPRYTDNGQPICLRCERVGHVARQCPAPRSSKSQSTANSSSGVQGNGVPLLL
ncbi:hypothetical protein QTP86_002422, partial [Hemibagrus guttatus]